MKLLHSNTKQNPEKMYRFFHLLDDVWNFLTTVFLAILLYMSPVKEFIHLVASLIVIDFMMGVMSSFKLDIPITAKRMVKTVYKLILYSVAIISTYLVQMIAGEDGVGLVRICALFIGATELKSIYDHITKILGGDLFVKLWQLIKARIDQTTSNKTNQNVDQGEG